MKQPAKKETPKRDTFAPTTTTQGRIAIFSPTDRPTTPIPKKDQPWPYVRVEIDGKKFGRAVIENYRPTERDRCIIQAIFTVGSPPNRNENGSGVVDFNVKEAARVAGCPRHVAWMIDEIKRIGRAEITIYKPNGKMHSWFHVLSQVDMIDDEHARVYFTAGYMHNWAVDRWVHNEHLVAEISRVKSPRVRAIIQRNLTHAIPFDETLDAALQGIDAMNVSEQKQRARRREIWKAERDGTLAKFGLRLYRNETTGIEHVAFDRSALPGLVQLDPADPAAPMPAPPSRVDEAG